MEWKANILKVERKGEVITVFTDDIMEGIWYFSEKEVPSDLDNTYKIVFATKEKGYDFTRFEK